MKKTRAEKKTSQKKCQWRKNPKVWTDTLFDKKLLANPSLMTNLEIAIALEEYRKWSTSQEKYDWQIDPIKEGKEDQAPFSPRVWGRIICELIARLKISGALAMGRFKSEQDNNSRHK